MKDRTRDVVDRWYSSHEEPLGKFLDRINAAFAAVPEQYRDGAKVVFTGGDSEESGSVWFVYFSPETADEIEAEKKREAEARAASEAYELKRYRELHKKFGGKN